MSENVGTTQRGWRKPLVVLLLVVGVAGGKFIGKDIGFVVGAGAGREIVKAIRSTPEGRAAVRGFESVAGDAETFLKPYKDSSSDWFFNLGAKAVARHLDTEEQAEILGLRLQLSDVMPVDDCAALFWDGKNFGSSYVQKYFKALPESARIRMSFLGGRATARYLRNEAVPGRPFATDEDVGRFYERYASTSELDALGAAIEPNSSSAARCYGARMVFNLALRAPQGSRDRAAIMRTVLGDDGSSGEVSVAQSGSPQHVLAGYEGVVINASLPDKPASLLIELNDVPQPPFGYITIGSPLGGSGPVMWRRCRADSVVLFSVSSSADSILWLGIVDEENVGGKYSIIGGVYRGQGGQWRAAPRSDKHLPRSAPRC